MKKTNKLWRRLVLYPVAYARLVVSHAEFRKSRGKRPSMRYKSISNPLHALKQAKADLADYHLQMEGTRQMLTLNGNLKPYEVEEMVKFGFISGPISLAEQVRYYYLKLKDVNPKAAEKMGAQTKQILREFKGISAKNVVKSIEKLCLVLRTFIGGIVIRYAGGSYTVNGDKLETICSPYRKKN